MIDKDHCVYIKQHKDKYILLFLYVDDILIAGNDLEFGQTIKRWLSSTFEMKDMGEASYILGVKIPRDHSTKLVALSQEHYIKKILKWFNMQDCNPIDSPFSRYENLSKEMGSKTPKEKRKISNGSLCYDVYKTRHLLCCWDG